MSIHNPVPKLVSYEVEDNKEVQVAVAIGDAQTGGWAIRLGDDVTKGSDDTPVAIGIGKDLKERMLQVVATVVDVRPETNRLSAVVTISGGPAGAVKVPQSFDDGGDGDTALLTTLVAFK